MNLQKLVEYQKILARSVVLTDTIDVDDLRFVIGVDQAFLNKYVISACVLLSYPELKVKKHEYVFEKVKFPYIPTFLMFREGMPAVRALRKICNLNRNTIVMVDGSGIAHPRKCGLATFLALKLGVPTIGVTKKKLYGLVETPKVEMESKPIYDEEMNLIGYSLKTCKRCKPIYISPGSYISPDTALRVVASCIKNHKLPEPIRLAHEIANKAKKVIYYDVNRSI